MTSGVANVRTSFYRGSLIDPHTGWLFSQKSGLLIFFESYKKSVSNDLKVYTHLFYANELGEPAKIKNSRLHSIECVCETWNELISGVILIKVNPLKWEYLKETTLKRKLTKICITCNHFRYSTTETFATVLICPRYEKRIPQRHHLLKGCEYWQKIERYFHLKHLDYSLI